MNKVKVIFLVTALFIFGRLVTQKVEATNYMYGYEEPPRQIIVDKQVKPDRWTNWEDNLTAEKFVFVANDRVDYKILVKNSGEGELKNITVIDYLPGDVNFVSASEGYSLENREIKWQIDKLNPGEEREFSFQAQVVSNEALAGRDPFCVVNRVKAEAETGEVDEDWAEICIETRVLGAEALPEAGANLVFGGIASLALSSLGIILKKIRD